MRNAIKEAKPGLRDDVLMKLKLRRRTAKKSLSVRRKMKCTVEKFHQELNLAHQKIYIHEGSIVNCSLKQVCMMMSVFSFTQVC